MGKAGARIAARLKQVSFLFVVMILIGFISVVATINTYEVISRKDIKLSDVINDISLTQDAPINQKLIDGYTTTEDIGSFGVPSKIKFPESRQHIDITNAVLEDGQWKASKGLAHTFISAPPIQKVFGQAIIYMRINTATTKHLGTVLNGDIVNIVTSEGWQLGYRVELTADNLYSPMIEPQKASQITVIMVDDKTGRHYCFNAELVKVGERIE